MLTELFTDPTVLLVDSTHRLARRRTDRMADLAAEPWIIRAGGHPVVEVLQRSAVAAGFAPTIAFQANDYQEAQAMVSVGLGIALAPRTATVNQHPDVRVVSLGDTAPPCASWSRTCPVASAAPPSPPSTTSWSRPRPRTAERPPQPWMRQWLGVWDPRERRIVVCWVRPRYVQPTSL